MAVSISIKGRPIRFSLKWLRPPPSPPDGSMTLFEHLRELRYRLVIASLAIILGMIVCGFFYPWLFELLTKPYYAGITDLKANRPEAITALVSNGLS
ncbi:MAG TPA: twin-arginine translocase subunit TatC, partial [Propionibacteriaceae bacterium]|nr:twin-arginine translocase subunit TatC [Propionibacteriaceae bacterium]